MTILIWKESRQVSKRLTTQYDTPAQRRLIGREIMVYHYCDDWVELRGPDGDLLDYCINDQLAPVNQGAIVDNKRLGHVLQMAQEVQTCGMMCDPAVCRTAQPLIGGAGLIPIR